VAGIVGRADLLACVLALISILSYARFISERDKDTTECSKKWMTTALPVRAMAPLAASVAAASAAMLAKETGVTVLGVCAIYDLSLQLRARRLRGQVSERPLTFPILFSEQLRKNDSPDGIFPSRICPR